MLTLRLIDPNDYVVLEDGQPIGRIRLARERSPAIWLWTVTVTIPGPPFGDARTIDEAKARFKAAWLKFKDKVGPEALAKAYAAMNDANRPDRYRRSMGGKRGADVRPDSARTNRQASGMGDPRRCVELRRRLEEMTESGTEPSEHRDMLAAISVEVPNTIRPLKSNLPEKGYTCGMYVFDFSEDPDYIDIALRGVYAGPAFFEWLLANHVLLEVDEADCGANDLIMYFNDGQWKHVGLWKLNDRVESKWGLGLLYNHARLEVPRNYGDEVRFFRSISPEDAIEHFLRYAQSCGLRIKRTIGE